MDFATCPSCQQSVLDDDAENCPFCGASMSGKPGAAPPKPAPAKTAQKAEKKPAASEPDTAESSGESDEPIQADKGAAAKAIPVRRKRVKGLVVRVRCPMCETEGWVPAKAAGQEVRCANKECLVPVFTAPELPKKAEPEPEKPASKISWPIVGAVALGLGIVGVGFATGWNFFIFEPVEPVQPSGPSLADLANKRQGDDPDDDPGGDDPGGDPPPVAAPSVATVRANVLSRMADVARKVQSYEKPTARGLLVAAYAQNGDLETAELYLNQLLDVPGVVAADKMGPLVEMGWAHLAAGDRNKAAGRIEEALVASKDLSVSDRTLIAPLANLAAALQVLGRTADADSVLARDPNGAASQQLELAKSTAVAAGTFDIDLEYVVGPFHEPGNYSPLQLIARLAARDEWDAAKSYALGRPEGADRSDSLVLYAELLAARAPADVDRRLEEAFASLDPNYKRIALARSATRRLLSGDADGARTLLVRAESDAPKPPGRVAELPDVKAVLDVTHGFGKSRPVAAMAAAEIARAAAVAVEQKSGTPDETTWADYEKALAFAAAHAPAFTRTSNQLAGAEAGTAAVRSELKEALGLPSLQDADVKLPDYASRLGTLNETSREGLRLKVAILSDAARRGLADRVWAFASSDEFEEAPAVVLANGLDPVLRHHAKTTDALPPAVDQQTTWIEPVALLDEDPAQVAKRLSAKASPANDTAVLRMGCLLLRVEGRPQAVQFVGGIRELLSAEAALFVEGQSAIGADPGLAWKQLDEATPFAGLTKVAACEGLLLSIRRVETPAVASAANGGS